MLLPRAFLLLTGLTLTNCLTATPFGDDLDVEGDVNQRAIARIHAVSPTPDFKFVAVGDTHDAYDETARAVDAINRRNDIRFVLHAGDLTDLSLVTEFETTHEVLSNLKVPYIAVIGNHDAIADGASIYQQLYGPRDFTFSYGRLKFVVFNSNALEFPGEAPNDSWLRQQHAGLAEGERVIWLTHQSVSAPDGENSEQAKQLYTELLTERPVVLAVHGHLEDYNLRPFAGSVALQCGTFQKIFTYTVVSVFDYGARFEFERCVDDDCEPVEPRVSE